MDGHVPDQPRAQAERRERERERERERGRERERERDPCRPGSIPERVSSAVCGQWMDSTPPIILTCLQILLVIK